MGCICPSSGNNISAIKNFKQKWKEESISNTTQLNIINRSKTINNYFKITKPFSKLTSNESWRSIIDYLSPTDMPIIRRCNK